MMTSNVKNIFDIATLQTASVCDNSRFKFLTDVKSDACLEIMCHSDTNLIKEFILFQFIRVSLILMPLYPDPFSLILYKCR